ncbi:cytochrome C biogenesis protein CcmA [Sinorhizobium fredii USDA 205]|uniref:Heme ABC exporter ATP-binding protein CcmA n=2 Tax=Rhizobium fredii TaxID=380 RepID=A0A844ADW5_RHIFR|nr:heme ABC exporter ATP-binding protein CcmA [Sinorhizobium fredii]AWM26887.1 ABC transporter involved in cytochrome c biogenesis ATPase component CcmA [Sinorhizobium fredii CCBAU 25509]KSV89421.1 cytochrome C biogenesis protein CcmA [Sinorhizobium fredii USDA 205]MQW97055.1 heme ABC exporter ATP-binding protein CcmA [Sinorhizobium fredii]MQX10312.1 heme ABC exporter ATP-binding protein CcmA [Sinorhizobium fredii]UTY50936.1 heme ABC exporter ATP-binding protein CcmA [Sinorhizobium fredii]
MRLLVESLSARRGEDLIFHDISFVLATGEALVVTGPNGSGKSTLLRVLAGLLQAESGRVSLKDGPSGVEHPRELSHYLGHRNAMKRELTVAENLSFWRRFLGNSPGGSGIDLAAAAAAVGLAGIIHLPFGYLSAGQQRRMAMAKLLVAYRPIWILDEPTAALDAGADRLFAGLVAGHLERGGMVIAATHQSLGIGQAKTLQMTGFAH